MWWNSLHQTRSRAQEDSSDNRIRMSCLLPPLLLPKLIPHVTLLMKQAVKAIQSEELATRVTQRTRIRILTFSDKINTLKAGASCTAYQTSRVSRSFPMNPVLSLVRSISHNSSSMIAASLFFLLRISKSQRTE